MSKVKSLIKGVTKARENLMTPSQRRRARKTQEESGPSSRRDMKDSDRPSLDLPKARGKEADIVKVPAAAGAGLLATMAGAEGFNRLKKAKREDAKKAGKATFKLGSAVYNTETGRKVEKKAKGGMASAAKTITSKTTRSRNKTKPRGVGAALRGYGKALK